MPSGGPKDETPPKVTSTFPGNYSLNFENKKITINFDEFVVLKELNKKFVVSPPLKKKPNVRLKGRSIVVYLEDSLKDNTTYTLDFADAIVDNNEGNALGDFQYIFSTGNTIDSLCIGGHLENAFDQSPIVGALVMVYESKGDSIPYTTIPDYICKTDSIGHFKIRNIKNTSYKIFALKDGNKDYKFNGGVEEIAFLDQDIQVTAEYSSRNDTIVKYTKDSVAYDSIYTQGYVKYAPADVFLRMFKEKDEQLYITKAKRISRKLLHFGFNRERIDSLKINLLGIEEGDKWFYLEKNITNDSLNYWISDSTIYNRDTLLAELQYMKTDSMKKLVLFRDTVKLNFKSKKKAKLNKKQKEKLANRKKESLKFDIDLKSILEINKNISLSFKEPVGKLRIDMIHLYRMKDSTEVSENFNITKDSLSILKFHIHHKWKAEEKYKLVIDSLAINNIYNLYNNGIEKTFSIREKEYYGELYLDFKNINTNCIIQLMDVNDIKTILQEKKINKDKKVKFSFLKAGTYIVKTIVDSNNNGKWDTGKYLDHLQAERVFIHAKEMKVRSNWSSEEEIILPLK